MTNVLERAKKVRRPLLALQILLEHIPFRPVRIACYQRFEMDRPPAGTPEGTVRVADPGDLEALVLCLDKRATYEQRFAEGETCLIALEGRSVVGYEWFSAKNRQIEQRYRYPITIPKDALYSYDAYTSESHRGKGVWRQVILGAAEVMKSEGRTRLIAHVDYGNDGSMAAHERVGFRPAGWFLYVRVLGVGFLKRLPREPRSLGPQP